MCVRTRSNVLRTGYYFLRNVRKLRQSLTANQTASLVHAFISSKVDYCNSLYPGLTDNDLHRLQVLQNDAARLILKSPRFVSAKPLLFQLHWLPIQQRIDFKICLWVYKATRKIAPIYINDLVSVKSLRNLRSTSASNYLLSIPRTKLVRSDYAFSVYGPKTWNNLPNSLKDS